VPLREHVTLSHFRMAVSVPLDDIVIGLPVFSHSDLTLDRSRPGCRRYHGNSRAMDRAVARPKPAVRSATLVPMVDLVYQPRIRGRTTVVQGERPFSHQLALPDKVRKLHLKMLSRATL